MEPFFLVTVTIGHAQGLEEGSMTLFSNIL